MDPAVQNIHSLSSGIRGPSVVSMDCGRQGGPGKDPEKSGQHGVRTAGRDVRGTAGRVWSNNIRGTKI